jgi:hypothetical protein
MKMMDEVSIASNSSSQLTNTDEKIKKALWEAFLTSINHVIYAQNS